MHVRLAGQDPQVAHDNIVDARAESVGIGCTDAKLDAVRSARWDVPHRSGEGTVCRRSGLPPPQRVDGPCVPRDAGPDLAVARARAAALDGPEPRRIALDDLPLCQTGRNGHPRAFLQPLVCRLLNGGCDRVCGD